MVNNEWHYLPVYPDKNKDVLVAMKSENILIPSYWDGRRWHVSHDVIRSIDEVDVVSNFLYDDKLVYCWMEMPKMPKEKEENE